MPLVHSQPTVANPSSPNTAWMKSPVACTRLARGQKWYTASSGLKGTMGCIVAPARLQQTVSRKLYNQFSHKLKQQQGSSRRRSSTQKSRWPQNFIAGVSMAQHRLRCSATAARDASRCKNAEEAATAAAAAAAATAPEQGYGRQLGWISQYIRQQNRRTEAATGT